MIQSKTRKVRIDAIFIRFMNYSDKHCVMANVNKVTNRIILIVDYLSVIIKEARIDLAKLGYQNNHAITN